ncbi:MAG: hypothetical protein JSV16_00895, partial [Candidatus Hydrogenedentota bacterium]
DIDEDLFVRVLTTQQWDQGDPLAPDPFDVTLRIHDIRAEGPFLGGGENLQIITESPLPDGTYNVTYPTAANPNVQLEAIRGTTPYTWSEVGTGLSGTGLSLSSAGIVSGTPAVAPEINFTARVTDSSAPAQTDDKYFRINIFGIGIDPRTLPPGTRTQSYGPETLTGMGDTSPYYWDLASGGLPAGLTFNPALPTVPDVASIQIQGTPTVDGTYAFSLMIKDTFAATDEYVYPFTITIGEYGLTILDKPLPPAIQGVDYVLNEVVGPPPQRRLVTLKAINVQGTATWVKSAGDLPPGLDIDDSTGDPASAAIVGTIIPIFDAQQINQAYSIYNFTARITDSLPDTNTRNFELKVLSRRTRILEAPPQTVEQQSDGKLRFVVSAEGGAPSDEARTGVDISKTPYYTYKYRVVPVAGTNSPPIQAFPNPPGPDDPDGPPAWPD